MPHYDYNCEACDHTFEDFQYIDDRNVPESLPCPECGEKKVKKCIGCTPHITHDMTLKPTNDWQNKLDAMAKNHPDGFKNRKW